MGASEFGDRVVTVFGTFYSRAVLIGEFLVGFSPSLPSVIGRATGRRLWVILSICLVQLVCYFTVENLSFSVFVSGEFYFCAKLDVGTEPLPSR